MALTYDYGNLKSHIIIYAVRNGGGRCPVSACFTGNGNTCDFQGHDHLYSKQVIIKFVLVKGQLMYE